MLEKIKAVIEREGLIPEGARVVVGVSGGADSVALLHILCKLGYELTAAHLNHGIRGAEADADEAFVKTLCKKLGVEFVTVKTDVPALASEKGISLEMAAREARHEFFRTFAPVRIALAHHADDQLETFFLRTARGAGSGGLSGMRYRQEVGGLMLVRPLLDVRHVEIIEYLKKNDLAWREDVTNADETIPRNLVRHQILPALGKLNERAAENLLRTMEILRDEDDFLSATAAMELDELHAKPKAIQRRIVQHWLIEHGTTPNFEAIEKVIEFATETDGTKALDLEGLRVVNEYGTLKVGQASSLSGQHGRLSYIRMKEGRGILRGDWQASVSLAKVAEREVTVRAPQPGDRMNPYGMEGSKKLQDIFTDLKIPKAQRTHWPVVECGGEIVWIPKYRVARGWALKNDTEPAFHLYASKID